MFGEAHLSPVTRASKTSFRPALLLESREAGVARREAVIEALRARGRGKVSIRLQVEPSAPEVAFAIPGHEAARLLENAKLAEPRHMRLRPNAELAAALREGFSLRGQYASADALFDALEASRKG